MQPDEMQLESILDECLQAIETGKATVNDCLARYPTLADDLESLLQMAGVLGGLEFGPQANPTSYFIEKTRQQLVDHMSTSARPKRSDASSGIVAPPISFPKPKIKLPDKLRIKLPRLELLPRALTAFAAILFAILFIGGSVVWASEESLPDQPLYPIKRLWENTQLWAEGSPTSKAELLIRFANRRLGEAMAMANSGSEELVRKLMHEYRSDVSTAVNMLESSEDRKSKAKSLDVLQNELILQENKLKQASSLPSDAATPALATAQQAQDRLNSIRVVDTLDPTRPRNLLTPTQPGPERSAGGGRDSEQKPSTGPAGPTPTDSGDGRIDPPPFSPVKVTDPPPSSPTSSSLMSPTPTGTQVPPTETPLPRATATSTVAPTKSPTQTYPTRVGTPTQTPTSPKDEAGLTPVPTLAPTRNATPTNGPSPTADPDVGLPPAATGVPQATPTQAAPPTTTAEQSTPVQPTREATPTRTFP